MNSRHIDENHLKQRTKHGFTQLHEHQSPSTITNSVLQPKNKIQQQLKDHEVEPVDPPVKVPSQNDEYEPVPPGVPSGKQGRSQTYFDGRAHYIL